jgi:hypothetical protein
MSKRRVGVEGLEPEGELYENSRRRLGVEGAVVALDEEALGRTGETGRRGEGGVTSVWSMDVNIAFACSVAMMRQQMKRTIAYTKEKETESIYSGKKKFQGALRSDAIKIINENGHEEIITPARHPRQRGESEG